MVEAGRRRWGVALALVLGALTLAPCAPARGGTPAVAPASPPAGTAPRPTPADTLARSGGGHYFKAGAYTQSNCTREVACGAENLGEVLVYRLEVSHRP
jgi:hypothetical protein